MKEEFGFEDLMGILGVLRGENGCPWDREQTHGSLKNCMVEEAYEVCEAIDRMEQKEDDENLCEELGDVLFQVAIHSQIAKEEGKFDINDVLNGICKKMIRRHPHVFDEDGNPKTEQEIGTSQVVKQWDEIKKAEKNAKSLEDTLDEIPKAFPALIRAQKVVKKVNKEIYSEEEYEKIYDQLKKGLKSLDLTVKSKDFEHFDEKLGNLLLDMVNMAWFLQINAENSLTNATNKFINRLIDVEHLA